MRDKLRNIKPFHFGPAQMPQDDYKFATEDPKNPPATISMPTPDDSAFEQI